MAPKYCFTAELFTGVLCKFYALITIAKITGFKEKGRKR